MSPVAIGSRRVRVTIEQVTEVRLPGGHVQEEFLPLGVSPVEWVEIAYPRASEVIAAQQQFGTVGAIMTLRYREDLTARMRAIEDRTGNVWEFLSPPVDPDGRRANVEVVVGMAA